MIDNGFSIGPHKAGGPRVRRLYMAVMLLAALELLAISILHCMQAGNEGIVQALPAQTPRELAEQAARDDFMAANQDHPELFSDYWTPGVSQPAFVEAGADALDDAAEIVCVQLNQTYYAISLEHLEADHIINLAAAGKAVSVTYCGNLDCVRVLAENASEPLALNVGGLDVDSQLVLELGGKLFGQNSPTLPLADCPYTRTTWGVWKQTHAQTKLWL